MTTATEILLAGDLTTGLNGREWSQDFTAERPLVMESRLEAASEALDVLVAPMGGSGSRIARGILGEERTIGVVFVQRALADEGPAARAARFEALAALVQEIRDFYVGQNWAPPSFDGAAKCVRWTCEIEGPWHSALARTAGTFFQCTGLVFQVARKIER